MERFGVDKFPVVKLDDGEFPVSDAVFVSQAQYWEHFATKDAFVPSAHTGISIAICDKCFNHFLLVSNNCPHCGGDSLDSSVFMGTYERLKIYVEPRP